MNAWVCVSTDWTNATQHVLKVRIVVETTKGLSTFHVSNYICLRVHECRLHRARSIGHRHKTPATDKFRLNCIVELIILRSLDFD